MKNPYINYTSAEAESLNLLGHIIKAFDNIIKNLNIACASKEKKDIEGVFNALNKATSILENLSVILEEIGLDIEIVSKIYDVSRNIFLLIEKANKPKSTKEDIEKILLDTKEFRNSIYAINKKIKQ